MSTEIEIVESGQEELIAELDEWQDYGTRYLMQVQDEIRDGQLSIEQGSTRHPVLRDVQTGQLVKGSGRPRGDIDTIQDRRGWN